MANAPLLLTIIVALSAISGLIRFALHRRRAARSLITAPSGSAAAATPAGSSTATTSAAESASRLDAPAASATDGRGNAEATTETDGRGNAEATTETDAERRERLVEQAFRAGAVPAVWYRHAKTALAAEAEEAERTRG